MRIGVTLADGASVGVDGKIYRWSAVASVAADFVEIPLSSGVNGIDGQYSSDAYQGRLYVLGHSDNILIDEHFRALKQGLPVPALKPVIAAGSGTGITATAIVGYVSYFDSATGERSSLSEASNSLSITNKDIVWTNLSTTAPDTRVTDIELWREVDGGDIRFVARRNLGISTVTENVATLALGEVAPDPFTRFPRCMINRMYHDRQWMAGDLENPDVVYGSELFFPERYGGLNFRTLHGEPVVGLGRIRDLLFVACPDSSYVIQGYVEDDLTLQLSDAELGAVNHNGIRSIRGNLWIPNNKSIFVFNGAWHDAMPEGHEEWRREMSRDPGLFEKGYGEYDPVKDTYTFKVNSQNALDLLVLNTGDVPNPSGVTLRTFGWRADVSGVQSTLGGALSPPQWSFVARGRRDECAGLVSLPSGRHFEVLTGSNDGKIRLENDWDDAADNSDGYGKPFAVRTGCLLMGDPGGNPEDGGKTFHRLISYVEAENSSWQVRAYAGDEETWQQKWDSPAIFVNTRAASLKTYQVTGSTDVLTAVPASVHTDEAKVSGRGLTYMIWALNAKVVKFRGFGGSLGPGPALRGYSARTPEEL